jgi:hypothetical protein
MFLPCKLTHTNLMKNLFLLTALSFIVLFAACKKEDEPATPTTPTTPTYFIKCKIDGTDHTCGYSKATDYDADLEFGGTVTYNSKLMGLSVYMREYTGVKTYSGTGLGAMIVIGDGTTMYSSATSTPVTVKVTEDNGTEFRGEFSGKLFDDKDSTKTVTVANGTFFLKKPGK